MRVHKLTFGGIVALAGIITSVSILTSANAANTEIDSMCMQESIAPTIVYATIDSGYDINVTDYIESLGHYAELAGTDDEVDIADAISEVLDCSINDAIHIIEKSDNMQQNMEVYTNGSK